MKKFVAFIVVLLILCGNLSLISSAESSVTVSTVQELLNAVENAESGSVIYLKGGDYRFDTPILFNGIKKNITISSAPGETAKITNACPVTEWEECTVNGVKALYCSANGKKISALFSESGKLDVTRLPETGYYYIDKPDLSDT
ncbi:MAG: hypothetical protein MJ212_06250, partial [Alphaproteobacteria bacterium]|nr:hypothetical protein [Alphaproteobacteria bacterium]